MQDFTDRRRGAESRTLAIGAWTLRLDGLDAALAAGLDERWGPFLERGPGGAPTAEVHVVSAGPNEGLPAPRPGEPYRIEPRALGEPRSIVSYGFALDPIGGTAGRWRLALADASSEPAERRVENGTRFVVAALALDAGGFALHAAGVLVRGSAFLYAGPSRAGKSTAVRCSRPAVSLGDDFGVVVRAQDGWRVAAVPFDNAERIGPDAPRGTFPLVRVLRVVQADRTRIEQPRAILAAASLLGTAAFPWAVPEQADALADRAARLVQDGRFAHLHFARDADLWSVLVAASP